MVHPAAMIRREVLAAVGGYQEVEWAEDYDLWLRLLDAGTGSVRCRRFLFDWYDSSTRLTRTHGRYSQDNFLRAKAHYLARIPARAGRGSRDLRRRPDRQADRAAAHRRRCPACSAFYEVNPRRIGKTIAGVPVLDQAELDRSCEACPCWERSASPVPAIWCAASRRDRLHRRRGLLLRRLAFS